jgi:thymidylate synthase (FAD)
MSEQSVKLIAKTVGSDELTQQVLSLIQYEDLKEKDLEPPNAEEVTSFITRVSNPSNQANFETAAKLMAYCIKHKHWSPFEHANFTVEIITSRAIAAQILRHRSFTFQEFSQRYAEANEFIIYKARRQDDKNRQNSLDDMSDADKEWFEEIQEANNGNAMIKYNQAIRRGIAKEQARFLLPLSTKTVIYMTGNLRSWIHYVELRADKATQLEHREIAEMIKKILCKEVPSVGAAMNWTI